MKNIAHLIESFSNNERCKLNSLLTSVKGGGGTKMATKILYMRMLNRATDISANNKNMGQIWIGYPKSGLSRPEPVKSWLEENKNSCCMNSADLLLYAAPSTYRNAIKHLFACGLIFVDDRNRIHIRYPHPDDTTKMLSLKFAKNAILSILKNEKSKNENAEPNDENIDDGEFWN